MRSLVVSTFKSTMLGGVAFAFGMTVAYGVGRGESRGFQGSYLCDRFGLPDQSFAGLRVDQDLQVFGVAAKGRREVPVGRLDLRGNDLAYLEIDKEVVAWPQSSLDPLADYIVDNAGDALLILEMDGERAKMSYVCRRN